MVYSMYYGEFQRIKRIERYLEKLAYLSVGLDFFVAVATYLVIRGYSFSSFMLLVGGYLLFAEVIIAATMFVAMIALKHYRGIIVNMNRITFNSKYPKSSRYRFLLGRLLALALRPLQ